MSPKLDYRTKVLSVIRKLKECKKRIGSWDEVSDYLEIPKRTMLRWVKTKKNISEFYIRLLDWILKEMPPQSDANIKVINTIGRLCRYKDKIGSWADVSHNLSIPELTMLEWVETKKIGKITVRRLNRLLNGLLNKMPPKLDSHSAIQKLLRFKGDNKSWGEASGKLSIYKRTIQRWVETGKMDKVSIRLLNMILKD